MLREKHVNADVHWWRLTAVSITNATVPRSFNEAWSFEGPPKLNQYLLTHWSLSQISTYCASNGESGSLSSNTFAFLAAGAALWWSLQGWTCSIERASVRARRIYARCKRAFPSRVTWLIDSPHLVENMVCDNSWSAVSPARIQMYSIRDNHFILCSILLLCHVFFLDSDRRRLVHTKCVCFNCPYLWSRITTPGLIFHEFHYQNENSCAVAYMFREVCQRKEHEGVIQLECRRPYSCIDLKCDRCLSLVTIRFTT